MRIAVTTSERGIDKRVEERFGRCALFAVLDTETGSTDFVPNQGRSAASGAGIRAAQQLLDLGVSLLITGRVGPNAQEILDTGNVKVISWTSGTVGEAFQKFAKQQP
jgi:predicted Fe-Mo cluster-binding NifX family protein